MWQNGQASSYSKTITADELQVRRQTLVLRLRNRNISMPRLTLTGPNNSSLPTPLPSSSSATYRTLPDDYFQSGTALNASNSSSYSTSVPGLLTVQDALADVYDCFKLHWKHMSHKFANAVTTDPATTTANNMKRLDKMFDQIDDALKTQRVNAKQALKAMTPEQQAEFVKFMASLADFLQELFAMLRELMISVVKAIQQGLQMPPDFFEGLFEEIMNHIKNTYKMPTQTTSASSSWYY